MASRIGGRVVHFANLPIKLLMPTNFTNITEIALKTIPSASKIEIKRVLESLYGFEVEKVQTLNMEGKKKKRGGLLIAKPDYKKAYVTLKNPLSLSQDLFPIRVIQEEKERVNKKEKPSFVEEGEGKKHWLDRKDGQAVRTDKGYAGKRSGRRRYIGDAAAAVAAAAKFPWSSMRGDR
ncbi:hypothetical protein HS088_TW13G00883 [Tripterygium wilfordii]|uniref:Large ribosomal subunit protein uL23m n=1 Tax=Tripterygium wilfordii TaxID=458696 RepID=A0A7J7CV68_TRIWF|nr:uncharacterized protein LOC120013373 [Tripterygium wilfordii]KAF5737990.1 hypothetical protein HS088_TW13G00883 [Tripterygium wilfordii]